MNKQANSRHCFVCGVENLSGLRLKFYNVEPGHVVAQINIPSQFQGYPGVVHGGIVAAMLDEVGGRTVLYGGSTRWMVTAKLEVRYRRPVPVGQKLMLEGKLQQATGRVAIVESIILDEHKNLLAEAVITLADMPESLQRTAGLSFDDWKVYPDSEEDQDDC